MNTESSVQTIGSYTIERGGDRWLITRDGVLIASPTTERIARNIAIRLVAEELGG